MYSVTPLNYGLWALSHNNGNKTCAYTTAFRAGDDRRLMHLVVMLLQLVG